MASAMRRILASVGVESSVVEKFEAQDITPDVVQTLSDTQMFELGVTTLGKRQLIRSLCRESVAGNASGARAAVNEVFGYPQQQEIRSTAPVADVISEARTLVQSLATSNRTGGGKLVFKGSSRTKAGKYGFPFKSSRTTGLTKGKVAAPRVHQKRVVVLDHKENCPEVYALADAMVLIDGNIRYQGNDDEIHIREKIKELMKGKEILKDITADDFDFVRVCNKKIRKPDGNVPFDALGVNTVYPTGAIYARLRKSVNLVFMDSDDEDFVKYTEDVGTIGRQLDEDFVKCTEDVDTYGTQSVSSTSTSSIIINPCTSTIQPTQPSTSTGPTITNVDDCFSTVQSAPGTNDDDDQVMKDKLTELFPNIKMQVIEEAVHDSITLEDAVDLLIEKNGDAFPSESLASLLKPLQAKLASKPSIRLEVDPYDLVSDAISFYKGPKFQPCQPIRVAFIGQPAIDSGGVKRQFYTDLFLQLVTTNQFKLFQGPNNRLLFYYDQTALNCGLFKLLGKMVAHSICQGCPGFPYLAPAMYYYLATGDINQASAYASIADIPNQEELNYVEKAMLSSKDEIAALNADDNFLRLMEESGLTVMLTDENRQMVVQGLITHLVLSKRIAMLDQFAAGLETLDVLPAVRDKPAIFESLFVASARRISPDSVKSVFKLKPSASQCTEATTIFNMVKNYIEDSSEEELKQLLKFSTGAEEHPPCGVILLESSRDNESIYASTCLCEIIIPHVMASLKYEDFRSAFSAAVDGNAFNCV